MRLLYVALTRAKQKLFINIKCGEKALKRAGTIIESCTLYNGDIAETVSEAKSFSDWLWAILIPGIPGYATATRPPTFT